MDASTVNSVTCQDQSKSLYIVSWWSPVWRDIISYVGQCLCPRKVWKTQWKRQWLSPESLVPTHYIVPQMIPHLTLAGYAGNPILLCHIFHSLKKEFRLAVKAGSMKLWSCNVHKTVSVIREQFRRSLVVQIPLSCGHRIGGGSNRHFIHVSLLRRPKFFFFFLVVQMWY